MAHYFSKSENFAEMSWKVRFFSHNLSDKYVDKAQKRHQFLYTLIPWCKKVEVAWLELFLISGDKAFDVRSLW